MQAPVTQSTGPGRSRHSGWYFLRYRGINCSQAVRNSPGNSPTEGCRDPSGLRRPKPTTPGAGVFETSNRAIRPTTCSISSLPTNRKSNNYRRRLSESTGSPSHPPAPGRTRPVLPPGGSQAPWPWRGDRFAKRALDILGSGLGLLLLAPLFAVVAIAILATSGRPIFWPTPRNAWAKVEGFFRMLKFRSMAGRDAEGATGPIWASNHDNRCTRVGSWLPLVTNIDEFPQLFQRLRRSDEPGVGPRPERTDLCRAFSRKPCPIMTSATPSPAG